MTLLLVLSVQRLLVLLAAAAAVLVLLLGFSGGKQPSPLFFRCAVMVCI